MGGVLRGVPFESQYHLMQNTVTLTRQDAQDMIDIIEESVKLDEFTIELMPVSQQTVSTLRMRIQKHKALLYSLNNSKS